MKQIQFFLFALTLVQLSAGSSGPSTPAASPSQAKTPDLAVFTVDDMLDVASLRIADLSDDGRWLVVASTTQRDRIGIDNYRFGDPTYIAPSLSEIWIVDLQNSKTQKLFPDRQQVPVLKWSPDAKHLAFLIFKGGIYRPIIWERATGKLHSVTIPAGKSVAANTTLEWSPTGDRLFVSLQTEEWRAKAAERFKYETKGPVVVHASKEPFLAWEDLRRLSQLRAVAAYDIASRQTREVLPELRINSYNFTQDGELITYLEDITEKTDYDEIGGTTNKVQARPVAGGEPRTLIKTTKNRRIIWSRDGRQCAYAEKGNIFFVSVDDKEGRQLTGKKETKAEKSEAEEAKKPGEEEKAKETYTPVRLSPDGTRLVATNKEGFWMIETGSGEKELFLKRDEEDTEAPRYEVIEWDTKGTRLYLSYGSRTKWERGVVRYDLASKKMEDLIKDGRSYSNFTLSRDGSTFVFQCSRNNRPSDLCAADPDFKSVRKILDSNPQLAGKKIPKAELFSYLNADGRHLYGVLYYPVDYVQGQKYPTVFIIYEDFFDDRFNGTTTVLNASGYAVVNPSVRFETGFPGEAWIKSVTAAANKLIDMGIADPERLGVQGTSYGGYATNLLITQTDRFKAAINISGKVNMISFYTDSPRLGVRNIHAPEKSQDRLGATLWQQPQKYIEHSAIMFADRIKTPLMLMTGEQDSNVPARQAMEMYYALRRLGKDVTWVQYIDGGHGMPTTTVDAVKDYHQRIIAWYDSHLKGDLSKKKDKPTADR